MKLIKYRKFKILKIKNFYKENKIIDNKKNMNEKNIIYSYNLYYDLKEKKICYNFNDKKYYSYNKLIKENKKYFNNEIIKDYEKFFNNNLLNIEIHIKKNKKFLKKYNYILDNKNKNYYMIIKENYI